jgi:hypothetical protein
MRAGHLGENARADVRERRSQARPGGRSECRCRFLARTALSCSGHGRVRIVGKQEVGEDPDREVGLEQETGPPTLKVHDVQYTS